MNKRQIISAMPIPLIVGWENVVSLKSAIPFDLDRDLITGFIAAVSAICYLYGMRGNSELDESIIGRTKKYKTISVILSGIGIIALWSLQYLEIENSLRIALICIFDALIVSAIILYIFLFRNINSGSRN